MDRILFFQIAKGRKDIPNYRIQTFRSQVGDYILYYLQLCGWPTLEELQNVHGEMYKAYDRLQLRFQKQEGQLHTYLVYDESFSRWLESMDAVTDWQELWKLPFYNDYHKAENAKWIMGQIPAGECPRKAYVLASGVGIQDWLPSLADKVQGIEFYLEFATKGLEDLQEMLLEEYGMLTEVRLVTHGEFNKLRLRSEEPVLVIDFSGNTHISVLRLKKGSIWVDMDAVEAKRHLIEDRRTGLRYLSLKAFWKREMLQTLDIISKFAYNTEVKIGRF